jgi:hypothetical protein
VENGGRLSPPPPHLRPLHRLLRTPTQKRSPLPSRLCGSPGNAIEPFFLLSRALPFIFGEVGLSPHHILRQGDAPWVTTHTSKIQQHEHSRRQNRQKSTQSSRNKPKQTDPGAGHRVPQGNRAGARALVYPESKDPSNPGVNLRIC